MITIDFQSNGSRCVEFAAIIFCGALLSLAKPSLAELALPGAQCLLALPGTANDWTEQEHWAWHDVCVGRVADLQRYKPTRTPEPGTDPQLLTSRFLETILFYEPYRGAISRQGVNIRGAHFGENLDLSHGTFDHDLQLSASLFKQALDLTDLHVLGTLSFEGSHFMGPLASQGLRVEHDLVMNWAQFSGDDNHELRLADVKVGGSLNLGDAVISGRHTVNMDSLTVGGHLFLNGNGGHESKYWDVWLQNARVGGIVNLDDTYIEGLLTMRGFEAGSKLEMLNSYFHDATMTNLRAKGDVDIEGPKQFHRADHRHSLDLSGAVISGNLMLGSDSYGALHWPDGASINLRNAAVFALQDGIRCGSSSQRCTGSWPQRSKLDGFKYDQLSGNAAESDADLSARSSTWWADWLAREKHVSPQPYEQLASVLRCLGHPDEAKDVLYEGRNRELGRARYPEKLWLVLQWALIGYGYRISRSLWWVLGFLCCGVVVLRWSGEGKRLGMPFGCAYSLDMLLPIIKLRDAHYKMDLKGWARYYFYFHKTMGYVLASFLIAGLSGLTK